MQNIVSKILITRYNYELLLYTDCNTNKILLPKIQLFLFSKRYQERMSKHLSGEYVQQKIMQINLSGD